MSKEKQYDSARLGLFKETLEIEKKACEFEHKYSDRYPFVVSIILTVAFACVTTLITTLNYGKLKYYLINCYGFITPMSWIFFLLFLLAFASIVVGCVFGVKVLFTKNTSVINTDSAMDFVLQSNKRIDDLPDIESTKEKANKYASEELNKYINQQIANFGDIAKREGEANIKRIKEMKVMLILEVTGLFTMILCYMVLAFICL